MDMPKKNEELGRKVKEYRKNKGYSTAELANKLNVSAGLINNIENARNDVFRLDLLKKLSNELDISKEYLIGLKPTTIDKVTIRLSSDIEIMYNSISDNNMLEPIESHIKLILDTYIALINKFKDKEDIIIIINKHILDYFKLLNNLNISIE